MSQCDELLAIMQRGEVVTPLRAFEVTGSLACHSRIAELRERGHDIVCHMKTQGKKRWGEYAIRQPGLFA